MYKNFNKYEVFADGRIWSYYSKKFLKPETKPDGYQRVCLMDNDGKLHRQYVHRVTWIAVNGEIPDGMELNHLDECKTNNHIDNLQLCTRKENCNYGTRNERSSASQINHPEKSKRVGAYDKNGELMMCFPSTAEAGRVGFNRANVSKCCNGKLKTHKGFEWRYLDE